MQQGSYLLLEPGMVVRGSDGEIGRVAEVVADENADIFRGITVSMGLFQPAMFIAGDRVVSVEGSVVTLDMTRDDALKLGPPTTG